MNIFFAGRLFLIYAGTAFILNVIWESLHAPYLYEWHTFTLPFWPLMVYAASVDTMMLLIIFLGGALVWRDWRWFQNGRDEAMPRLYVVTAGIAIAAVIEIKAVYIFHQWAYSSLMPTVFGLGLSPLVQLAITGLAALWVVSRLYKL